MLPFIYVFVICIVATMLFVVVDEFEPNRRYALVLKFLIVFTSVACKGCAECAKRRTPSLISPGVPKLAS